MKPIVFKSIAEMARAMGMPAPQHPLVALVNYDIAKLSRENVGRSFLLDFYKISFKKDFKGQVKYGQGYYDFEQGALAFVAPNQLVTMTGDESSYDGYTLYFHTDFISKYQLGKNIQQYGFFSYAVNEGLFVSNQEKDTITGLFKNIAAELDNSGDRFSQDILVTQIELLLNYSNRFYSRQFITRKVAYNDLISKLDQYLTGRLQTGSSTITGLPKVQEISAHLQVSPRYLTDMLKLLTGKSTLQYIHDRLIERAKVLLCTSKLTVAEIAYDLGFEHPQSFHKLFKQNTRLSPNGFRRSVG